MSSSDRRTLLWLLAAAPLAACGYAPAYAPGGAVAALVGQVRADDPRNRNEFDFVERLEERLGRPDGAAYALSYRITTRRVRVGVTTQNDTTRFHLEGQADWTLTRRADGGRIATGRERAFTAWFNTGTAVATLAAEEDAAQRLMRLLADQIVMRLTALPDLGG
jgi:LPS-assembly lipoprotein